MQVDKNDEVKRYWDKTWPDEVPKTIEYENISLGQMLRNAATSYPDSQAIYFEGWRCTYKELDTLVDQFSTALSKMGIKKGDVVLIDLPNVPQFIISFFGIVRIGAIANPIIPLNRFTEIVHQVNDSKGKMLVMLDVLYEEHLKGKELGKMPTLENIILTGIVEYLSPIKAKLGSLLGKVPQMKEWPSGKLGNVSFQTFQDFLHMGIQ